ncbi:hypothetical protein J8L70_10640 [Pseudoalteromonas sp. MMG010]|uniref:hypothetical protein n=1 Tax=Pseudoalteromonas sp. MMG010 TaxID=2822685 RepID=UPI001B3A4BCC|nr:hypothetical protein [Pseudoalteromonas sp. MMG010]MBQ4833699.1 hypothetical protein [Pseudoalteromonas sp. MMG010]
MAKPNKKGPSKTVNIFCSRCKTLLLKYRKGGTGALVKCFKERIVDDHTTTPHECPHCQQVFSRFAMIKGTPAYKIIGGKLTVK